MRCYRWRDTGQTRYGRLRAWIRDQQKCSVRLGPSKTRWNSQRRKSARKSLTTTQPWVSHCADIPLRCCASSSPRWASGRLDSLRTMAEDRQKVRACGIVTHRQQPSTASGVIFATLEDETGTTNIIVWPSLAEEQRRALRGSMLLTVGRDLAVGKRASNLSWPPSSQTTLICFRASGSAVAIFDRNDSYLALPSVDSEFARASAAGSSAVVD
jgi:hypothetical protein